MVKPIVQNVGRRLSQLGEDIFETAKKQPGEMAGKALEQTGVTSGKMPAGQQKQVAFRQQEKIEEMKALDEAKSRQLSEKIVRELEMEIKKLRQIRGEQLHQRRQAPEPLTPLPETQPLQEPTLKKQRGVFGGFWGRRVKSAQQQSQPEMVGRRIGG